MTNFNEFCNECFEIARKFMARRRKYTVALRVGNSQADTRVAPALVVKDRNGYQKGYVKLFNCDDRVKVDACCMCHAESYVNPNDKDEVKAAIEYGLKWVMD